MQYVYGTVQVRAIYVILHIFKIAPLTEIIIAIFVVEGYSL